MRTHPPRSDPARLGPARRYPVLTWRGLRCRRRPPSAVHRPPSSARLAWRQSSLSVYDLTNGVPAVLLGCLAKVSDCRTGWSGCCADWPRYWTAGLTSYPGGAALGLPCRLCDRSWQWRRRCRPSLPSMHPLLGCRWRAAATAAITRPLTSPLPSLLPCPAAPAGRTIVFRGELRRPADDGADAPGHGGRAGLGWDGVGVGWRWGRVELRATTALRREVRRLVPPLDWGAVELLAELWNWVEVEVWTTGLRCGSQPGRQPSAATAGRRRRTCGRSQCTGSCHCCCPSRLRAAR